MTEPYRCHTSASHSTADVSSNLLLTELEKRFVRRLPGAPYPALLIAFRSGRKVRFGGFDTSRGPGMPS